LINTFNEVQNIDLSGLVIRKRGTYEVKVKARDGNGMESDWGILSVTMPYEPQFLFNHWLFERFPNAFPLLRFLLGY
jgi:hypothetical protein